MRHKFLYLSVALRSENEKNISTYGIRMQKNPQTRAGIFCNFADFHGIMQVQPTLPHGYFINGVANPEIIYLEIFVLFDTNCNDFLIFNNFLISFKRRKTIAISWNYSSYKKTIKDRLSIKACNLV